jgi:hypothetical protein
MMHRNIIVLTNMNVNITINTIANRVMKASLIFYFDLIVSFVLSNGCPFQGLYVHTTAITPPNRHWYVPCA